MRDVHCEPHIDGEICEIGDPDSYVVVFQDQGVPLCRLEHDLSRPVHIGIVADADVYPPGWTGSVIDQLIIGCP